MLFRHNDEILSLQQIIGGFQKQSLIDWEGRVVAVIFTKGCNLRCRFCHNPSLVLPGLMENLPTYSLSLVYDYLCARANWLDGVVITGGEPTIHPQLPKLISLIVSLGYEVKLDTNGTNPSMLSELLAHRLLNYIAVDIKTLLERTYYQQITGTSLANEVDMVKRTIEILRASGIGYQLRTTVVPKFHSHQIVELLKNQFKFEKFVLQEFRDGDTIEKYSY